MNNKQELTDLVRATIADYLEHVSITLDVKINDQIVKTFKLQYDSENKAYLEEQLTLG